MYIKGVIKCNIQKVALTYVRMETLSRTSLRTLVVIDMLIWRVKVIEDEQSL